MNTKKLTIHSIFLNQSDQHFLKDYLRDEINLLEQYLLHYQKQAAYFWSKCDPQGQPNNAYYYLNESKDGIRSTLRKLSISVVSRSKLRVAHGIHLILWILRNK